MKILLISQYFWPEQFIINDLVKTLVSKGHSVKVLTGKPNYPGGDVFAGYRQEGTQSELFVNKVSVFRVPLRPRKKGGSVNLLLNYLSFVWNGLRYFPRAVKGESFDVIFVFAPSPITMVIPAIYLKWKLKTHLVIWIQDLWPESLSATGFIKNRVLLRLVGGLVRSIYSRADTLLVQSEGFVEPVSRYACFDKIVYYPNSFKDNFLGENSEVTPINNDVLPSTLTELFENYFCVTFAGNLGTAQSLETIVAAAKKLKHLRDVRIVLVGSGSMLDWLLEQKEEQGLDNLVLSGHFPVDSMPDIFLRSQGLLVTLKREEIFSYTVPSKIQAYLASGRPIVAVLDGEGARIIEEAGAGLTCSAEDVDGLVKSIETLYGMSSAERDEFGYSGRKYFLEHFEMKSQAVRLIELLGQRINSVNGG